MLDEQVARELNSILSDNTARSFVFGGHNYLTLSDRPVAAKTGTTNDFRDAWTIGYTPSLAAGVWVGNNDNTSMKAGAAGSVVAAPIWNAFMERLLVGTPVETFKAPRASSSDKTMLNGQIDIVHKVSVDSLTQRAIPDDCLSDYPEKYITEKTFKETHTILRYVSKYSPLGDAPNNPADDPQYSRWEQVVNAWANGQPGYITSEKPLEYESCELREDTDNDNNQNKSVSLVKPKNNATIKKSPLVITANVGSSVKLDKIELYIDNELIGTLTKTPYRLEYNITDMINGFYTVEALFYEDNGSVQQKSRDVNILLSQQSSDVYLTQPLTGSSVSADDFPYTLSGVASHPDGIKSVSVYYSNSVEKLLINKTTDLDTNQFTLDWLEAPEPADYQLTIEIETNSDEIIESDSILVTITD